MRPFFLFTLMLLTRMLTAQPVTDTIHPGQLQLKYLPAGKQSYLVYIVNKEGVKKSIWLWERHTSRESFQNQEAFVIRQEWTTSDTGFNSRKILSVVRAADFSPVYHFTQNPKTGIESFDFHSTEIVTSDSVPGAGKKGFKMPLKETSFNWELDLETFPLLPLKEGRSFVINFYHPGSSQAPAWYTYTVTGSETLRTVDGKTAECFKLYTEYGNNRGNSTWWLSKKTHEVLKMEEHFGPVTRYKIRLSVGE